MLKAHLDLSPSYQHFSVEKEISVPILVVRGGDIETFKASSGLVHQREVEIVPECACDAEWNDGEKVAWLTSYRTVYCHCHL